jgi:hypothetical protein
VNSNNGINPFARIAHPHAVNRFRNGPYRTVHNLDGSLATGTLWYEVRWAHETPSVKFDGADKVRKNLKTWWNRLQQNPLKNHIKQGLLRYCRALDMHEADPSLTEMWGALESLTGTQREKGDLTVDRIAQLFLDRDNARQIANHIRVQLDRSRGPDAKSTRNKRHPCSRRVFGRQDFVFLLAIREAVHGPKRAV